MSFFSTVLNPTMPTTRVIENDLDTVARQLDFDSVSDSDSDSCSDFMSDSMSDSEFDIYNKHLDFLKAFNDLIFALSVFYKLYDGSSEFASDSITFDSIIEDLKTYHGLQKTFDGDDYNLDELVSNDWCYVYFLRNFPELQEDDPRYISHNRNFFLKLLKGIVLDGPIDDMFKRTMSDKSVDPEIIDSFKRFLEAVIDDTQG